MTERKFKSYTLWLKWKGSGWQANVTASNLPWPSDNPRDVLKHWMECSYLGDYWVRGKTWMILPEGRKPRR